MKTFLGLLSVCSMAVFAAGCATGVEGETEAVDQAEQAVTLDSPAAPAVAAKAKQSVLAGALASCSVSTSGANMNVQFSYMNTRNQGVAIKCTTIGGTTKDSVLAVLQHPTSNQQQVRNPCSSPWNVEIPYRVAGINDDTYNADGSLQSRQSTVIFNNTDVNVTNYYRLAAWLWSGNNGGSVTVTCSTSPLPLASSPVWTTIGTYTGTLSSGTCKQTSTSSEFTAAGGDTTILAIADNISNQNHKFNDDTADSSSKITGMTTGVTYWMTDLCGYGATTNSPRTTTFTY